MKNFILVFALALGFATTPTIHAEARQSQSPAAKANAKEKLTGLLIREQLSRYHYTQKKLDDNLSKLAFDEVFKRFDYGRQFFLQKDVDKLAKYRYKLDNELMEGEYKLLDEIVKIYFERIDQLNAYRKEVFKKKFSFKEDERLELDPEKRKFAKSFDELKDHWRKVYKQSVLNNYIASLESQKELKEGKKKDKKKDKKKGKEEKILTDKEMRDKAHKSVNEKYEKFFARLKKDKRMDHFEKYINAIAGIYDPHTNYFPPKRKEDFDIDISGQLEGIGAVLQEDGQFIKVVRIVPGGAAWRQKELEVDDIILSAGEGDGEPKDLVNLRVDEAVRYIRGKKGTIVKLTVKKADGSRKVIPIERDVVQIEASYAKGSVLEHKDLGIKVGYIHVPKFYRDFNNAERSCTQDVLMELKRLKKQKIDGMILDLRNNGGGALTDAQEMSGLFIKEGPIVQIRKHTGDIDVLRDTNEDITYDGPLIVMVNRFSASASEILAGAMQDYKRAVIVGGENTHGKGTVQAILEVTPSRLWMGMSEPLGAMKMTIQKFYRITGVSTQFKGVTPDIILPDPMGYADNREQDLDHAIPWDTVEAQKYDEWKQFSYNLNGLIKASKKRVAKSDEFKKIIDSVNYLRKRKDDTLVSLNLKKVLKEDEESKKMTDSFKIEKENKKIVVSHFEESLMAHEKVEKADLKRWKKDFEQRKEDWVKTLTKDPMIGETLFIMNDIVHDMKAKKLTKAK